MVPFTNSIILNAENGISNKKATKKVLNFSLNIILGCYFQDLYFFADSNIGNTICSPIYEDNAYNSALCTDTLPTPKQLPGVFNYITS